jgi:hypothetical protein
MFVPCTICYEQGRIQDFKLGGANLKKIAPSGGRCEKFWGISYEKSRFYAKKIIFFPILGGGSRRVRPPPPPPLDPTLKSILLLTEFYVVINKTDKTLITCLLIFLFSIGTCHFNDI